MWTNGPPFHVQKRPHHGLRTAVIDGYYIPTDVKKHLKNTWTRLWSHWHFDNIQYLQDWFDQSDFNMYAKLEQVLIKSAKSGCCPQELEECCLFYGSELNANTLKMQLQILSCICKEKELETLCISSYIITRTFTPSKYKSRPSLSPQVYIWSWCS